MEITAADIQDMNRWAEVLNEDFRYRRGHIWPARPGLLGRWAIEANPTFQRHMDYYERRHRKGGAA